MNAALTLGSFAFFTALVAAITWWKSRGGDTGSNDGFFLAGRSLTFPFIAASLLLTNLSTEQLVGLNGQAYTTGLAVMMWEVVSVVAIAVGYFGFPEKVLQISEYNFVTLCFLGILDVMLLMRLLSPSARPYAFRDARAVSLAPWKGAKWAAAALLLVILGTYAAFADFTVLRDAAGKYPFLPFLTRFIPLLLPTLLLLWLDRRAPRPSAA